MPRSHASGGSQSKYRAGAREGPLEADLRGCNELHLEIRSRCHEANSGG